jgi:hypothetical protein
MWSSSGVNNFGDETAVFCCPLDAHMCLSWWVVFSLVCCAACLVLSTLLIDKNLNCDDFKNEDWTNILYTHLLYSTTYESLHHSVFCSINLSLLRPNIILSALFSITINLPTSMKLHYNLHNNISKTCKHTDTFSVRLIKKIKTTVSFLFKTCEILHCYFVVAEIASTRYHAIRQLHINKLGNVRNALTILARSFSFTYLERNAV